MTVKFKKQYIGDGAYMDFDGYNIILTAENGIQVTDRIYLEPEMLKTIQRLLDEHDKAVIASNPPG